MEYEILQLECLKIAASLDLPPDKVLGYAERLVAFVMGQNQR